MRGKLLTTTVLTLVLSFFFPSSGLQASESIRVYMGFSREVNEALAKKIEEKLGIGVSQTTLSWGEMWDRLMNEAPSFGANMVISFGAAQALDGKKMGYYVCYQSPAYKDIDTVFKDKEAE